MACNASCWCIVISAFIAAIVVVCVYFTHPSNPVFTINQFYVSALNLSDISSTTTAVNQTIFFDMKLHNKNEAMGAYYDPVTIIFYYIPNIKLTFAVAQYTLPKFYQHKQKSKHVIETVTSRGIAPYNRTITSSVFIVEVITKVGFTSPAYRKKERVHVVANVRVGQTGGKESKKGIKLFDSGVGGGFGGFGLQIGLSILSTANILVIS